MVLVFRCGDARRRFVSSDGSPVHSLGGGRSSQECAQLYSLPPMATSDLILVFVLIKPLVQEARCSNLRSDRPLVSIRKPA